MPCIAVSATPSARCARVLPELCGELERRVEAADELCAFLERDRFAAHVAAHPRASLDANDAASIHVAVELAAQRDRIRFDGRGGAAALRDREIAADGDIALDVPLDEEAAVTRNATTH